MLIKSTAHRYLAPILQLPPNLKNLSRIPSWEERFGILGNLLTICQAYVRDIPTGNSN